MHDDGPFSPRFWSAGRAERRGWSVVFGRWALQGPILPFVSAVYAWNTWFLDSVEVKKAESLSKVGCPEGKVIANPGSAAQGSKDLLVCKIPARRSGSQRRREPNSLVTPKPKRIDSTNLRIEALSYTLCHRTVHSNPDNGPLLVNDRRN